MERQSADDSHGHLFFAELGLTFEGRDLRVMFTVEDIDDTLARLRRCGAQLVGEVVQYEDAYRLCCIRGPEGLLIGLAQELG